MLYEVITGPGVRPRRYRNGPHPRKRRPRDRGRRRTGRLPREGRPGGHPRFLDREQHPGIRDARRLPRAIRVGFRGTGIEAIQPGKDTVPVLLSLGNETVVV